MLKRSLFALLPVALLAAACSSGGDVTTSREVTDPSDPPAAAIDTSDEPIADTATTSGSVDTAVELLTSFNPFELLNAVGDSSSLEVDPQLAEPLLSAGDLPGDFMSLGEDGFSAPTEIGSIDMAISMFARGDLASQEFGAMVMSLAARLPPEALAELGDPNQLAAITQAEVDRIEGEFASLGEGFGDFRILDASGLGDGGLGMRLEIDFGQLLGALGATDEENPLAAGIAMEMYMFFRGEHMLMVMVMSPIGESTGVDARDLAEIMNEKAADAF